MRPASSGSRYKYTGKIKIFFLYFYKGHGQLFYQTNKKGHKNITGTEFMLHLVIQVSTTNPGSAL